MPPRIGEREIIKTLTKIYGSRTAVPLGYDDDVSAVPLARDCWIIVKSDMLVWSTDVPPGMRLWQAGRKAIVSTVSDFAAKGVKPKALMVSLGLPRLTRPQLLELGNGLRRGAVEYGCKIIGGDTGESKELVIDCLGVGQAAPNKLVTRGGARAGDLVAVTGKFGNSAAGLRMILSKRMLHSHEGEVLEQAVFMPEARLTEGLALARTGSVTSSIDSSDGLAWSLHELARNSKVSIRLDRVPVASEAAYFAVQARISPIPLALYGGEEYELVFTFKGHDVSRVKRAVPSALVVGRVERGPPRVTATAAGRTFRVQKKGYEHFLN